MYLHVLQVSKDLSFFQGRVTLNKHMQKSRAHMGGDRNRTIVLRVRSKRSTHAASTAGAGRVGRTLAYIEQIKFCCTLCLQRRVKVRRPETCRVVPEFTAPHCAASTKRCD
jgi:hypothetical protein